MSPPRLGALVRALRLRQWVKNILVAAAPVAASTLDEGATLARTIAAFVIFVAASGTTYLFNDVADVQIDQLHPTKRRRPIAAEEISLRFALQVAAILGIGSVVGATLLAWQFGVVIAIYLGVNLAYSAGLKRWPAVELAAIASGFVLRAVGGGAATDTPLSAWFVVVVCAASLFVVAGKRSAELIRTAGNGGRPVLQHYTANQLRLLRAVTAAVALVAYSLWVVNQDLAIEWLAALSLLPFGGALARYSTAIEAGRGEDPEDIALGDRGFQLMCVGWIVIYGVAVYG